MVVVVVVVVVVAFIRIIFVTFPSLYLLLLCEPLKATHPPAYPPSSFLQNRAIQRSVRPSPLARLLSLRAAKDGIKPSAPNPKCNNIHYCANVHGDLRKPSSRERIFSSYLERKRNLVPDRSLFSSLRSFEV